MSQTDETVILGDASREVGCVELVMGYRVVRLLLQTRDLTNSCGHFARQTRTGAVAVSHCVSVQHLTRAPAGFLQHVSAQGPAGVTH